MQEGRPEFNPSPPQNLHLNKRQAWCHVLVIATGEETGGLMASWLSLFGELQAKKNRVQKKWHTVPKEQKWKMSSGLYACGCPTAHAESQKLSKTK